MFYLNAFGKLFTVFLLYNVNKLAISWYGGFVFEKDIQY